jgi:DNA repair exonuclease SbcCD ATPase subunit
MELFYKYKQTLGNYIQPGHAEAHTQLKRGWGPTFNLAQHACPLCHQQQIGESGHKQCARERERSHEIDEWSNLASVMVKS